MKNIFLFLALSLCIASAKAEERSYTELVDKFPEMLQKGSALGILESLSDVHYLNEVLFSGEILSSQFLRIRMDLRKAKNKMYEQTFKGGDNILHLLVRSEKAFERYYGSSFNAEQEGTAEINYEMHSTVRQDLYKAIEFVYFILGPKRFIKLLDKPNKEEGISPALLAANRNGEASKALQKFFQIQSTVFTPISDWTWPVVFSTVGIAHLFVYPDPGNFVGLGTLTAGMGLCYMSFKKKTNIKKMNKDLSHPLSL